MASSSDQIDIPQSPTSTASTESVVDEGCFSTEPGVSSSDVAEHVTRRPLTAASNKENVDRDTAPRKRPCSCLGNYEDAFENKLGRLKITEENAKEPRLRIANVPLFYGSDYYKEARGDIVAMLEAEFLNTCYNPSKGIFAVFGGPGVGKTASMAHVVQSLSEKAVNKNVAVIWLNCDYNTRKYTFNSDILDGSMLGAAKELDPTIDSTVANPREILPHFARKGVQIAFILDGVVDELAVQHLLAVNKSNLSNLAMCVIARSPSLLEPIWGFIKRKVFVKPLGDEQIFDMLSNHFGLEGTVSEGKLRKLAENCFGLPLIASLIAPKLQFKPRLIDEILKFENLKELKIPLNRKKVNTIAKLLKTSLELLENDPIRNNLFSLLLFEPLKNIPLEILSVLWHKRDADEVQQLVAEFEQLSVIRKKDDSVMLTPLITDAAIEMAFLEYEITDGDYCEKIKKLRKMILTGSTNGYNQCCHEMMLFEAVRKQCLQFVNFYIDSMTAADLADFCLRKSTFPDENKGLYFLHFLYQSKWNLDKRSTKKSFNELLDVNTSYKLIRKILFKLRFENQDNTIDFAEVVGAAENSTNGFLKAILADKANGKQHSQRELLIQMLSQFHCSSDSSILSVVRSNNLDTMKRLGIDCLTFEIFDNAIMEAVVCGSFHVLEQLLNDFSSLHGQHEKFANVLNSAMFSAAKCGHWQIVELFLDKFSQNCSVSSTLDDFKSGNPLRTLLHHAAQNGDLDLARLLSCRAGNIWIETKPDGLGENPIVTAAKFGHIEMVKFLIEEARRKKALPVVFERLGAEAVVAACCLPETLSDDQIKVLVDDIGNFTAVNDISIYSTVSSLILLSEMSKSSDCRNQIKKALPVFALILRYYHFLQVSLEKVPRKLASEHAILSAISNLCDGNPHHPVDIDIYTTTCKTTREQLINFILNLACRPDSRLSYDNTAFMAGYIISQILLSRPSTNVLPKRTQKTIDDQLAQLVVNWITWKREDCFVLSCFTPLNRRLHFVIGQFGQFHGVLRFVSFFVNFLVSPGQNNSLTRCYHYNLLRRNRNSQFLTLVKRCFESPGLSRTQDQVLKDLCLKVNQLFP